jgi:hypothetical protein
LFDREHPYARCRQLNRQWDAIQSLTDLSHRTSILVSHAETWLYQRCPIAEELHRFGLHQAIEGWQLLGIGQ